jgi:hypothetical protein
LKKAFCFLGGAMFSRLVERENKRMKSTKKNGPNAGDYAEECGNSSESGTAVAIVLSSFFQILTALRFAWFVRG